jgi:hypothetical protein
MGLWQRQAMHFGNLSVLRSGDKQAANQCRVPEVTVNGHDVAESIFRGTLNIFGRPQRTLREKDLKGSGNIEKQVTVLMFGPSYDNTAVVEELDHGLKDLVLVL